MGVNHSKSEPLPAMNLSAASTPVTFVTYNSSASNEIDAARDAARQHLESLVHQRENALVVVDLGTVFRMFKQWNRLLPRVDPFYAVKCNEDALVLETLNALGAGFDCASAAEIARVVGMGVTPDRIIYANPTKQASHVRYAESVGVTRMTFDNHDELIKIGSVYPNAELVVRVLVNDQYSVCKLGTKFGAHPLETRELLEHAKQLGLNVIGVSFHVGSGCQSVKAFSEAVKVARGVFDEGLKVGFNFTLLDIGGGFPGTNNRTQAPVSFAEIAETLTESLDEHFPAESGVRIIAEPGRYMVCASHTEACCVTSRRIMPNADDGVGDSELISYYINDGVYGSFNCTLFDHVEVFPQVLVSNALNDPNVVTTPATVWGPTCDSMDKVAMCTLPKLDVGDWLWFEDMGAYTCAAASTFNGFAKPTASYIFSAHADFDFGELPHGFPSLTPGA
eukprot:m.161360 g.161360  ORF g.161360 m.161360 type:complete len:450 (-) comp12065_c0_seq1:237-1586(-)